MEDAVCCAQVQEGSTLLGIFDGHGGGLCAELTSKLLPSMVHLFLRQPLSLEDVMHQSFRYMDLLL
jgi:serine/threonine protein phosphatase PrpC